MFKLQETLRKSQNRKYFNGKTEDLSAYIPEGTDLHNKCELLFNQRMYLVLKGVALGDFAGQPYEAASLDYCKNLSQDLIYKKAKDCTDDTILACATAVAIKERKQYAKETFGEEWKKAYSSVTAVVIVQFADTYEELT